MIFKYLNHLKLILFIYFFLINSAYSEVLKSIQINGNDRISNKTIEMFGNIEVGDNVNSVDLNDILKKIYETNFFENVSVNLDKNILTINVIEYPIIQNINYNGIKANKIKDVVFNNLKLKPRSSFVKIFLQNDKKKIENSLKELGYYFSKVDVDLINLEDNKVDITYNVELGKKAKIKKISFIGNKIYKDKKLKRLIVSEEYKFWKIISGKKYLNQSLINFDERLLKNFYLNKGFFKANIKSSFAKLVDEDEFELIFNIDANKKFYFNNLSLKLPDDFEEDNFSNLFKLFKELNGEVYSINKVDDILEEIDKVTLLEQFESISANVVETLEDDKINLLFTIEKTKRQVVEKINIFGNNVTRENVIRNQFEFDEGDPFNEILRKKTINNVKNLRFFKSVDSEVVEGNDPNSKIINISVEEKPTGEIAAGAGIGTNGGSVMFSVKENNYLGKGIQLKTSALIREDSVKGIFQVNNPNFNNSDKAVNFNLESSETNRLANFGYKTTKTGFSFGTNFEFYDDLNLGLGNSNYYEKMVTDSSASERQKKQEGNYWDSFLNIDFDYDKRNQKFQTTEGYRSQYFISVPIVSKTNSLSNTYNYQYYSELYEGNVSNISLYMKSINSLSNDDVKLSERIFIPSNRLRGFESGKVGPKDGNDFVGGNYATAINFSSTIPQLFENSQSIDILFFVDAANLWGVDYDNSLNDSSKIRSSIGLGVDWLTPIGPLNFSFAETLSKADTDVTQSFSFNLGTTF
ncbi:outer membrane protein assembly factor BamA [Candidatus Pelagibacter sp.]|uniref:outer membrane protein assembly factor BamA n=1 Tax=Candidatus Pelagibacter sp. TaxID=2024849 RepID=UPI003F835D19